MRRSSRAGSCLVLLPREPGWRTGERLGTTLGMVPLQGMKRCIEAPADGNRADATPRSPSPRLTSYRTLLGERRCHACFDRVHASSLRA